MGVDRYKKSSDAFRSYVELLETTPLRKREHLIQTSRAEDPNFMDTVESYIITYKEIMACPDQTLMEIMSELQPNVIAAAIAELDEAEQARFLKLAPGYAQNQIRADLKIGIDSSAAGGAKRNWIIAARKCEREGRINFKKIPREIEKIIDNPCPRAINDEIARQQEIQQKKVESGRLGRPALKIKKKAS